MVEQTICHQPAQQSETCETMAWDARLNQTAILLFLGVLTSQFDRGWRVHGEDVVTHGANVTLPSSRLLNHVIGRADTTTATTATTTTATTATTTGHSQHRPTTVGLPGILTEVSNKTVYTNTNTVANISTPALQNVTTNTSSQQQLPYPSAKPPDASNHNILYKLTQTSIAGNDSVKTQRAYSLPTGLVLTHNSTDPLIKDTGQKASNKSKLSQSHRSPAMSPSPLLSSSKESLPGIESTVGGFLPPSSVDLTPETNGSQSLERANERETEVYKEDVGSQDYLTPSKSHRHTEVQKGPDEDQGASHNEGAPQNSLGSKEKSKGDGDKGPLQEAPQGVDRATSPETYMDSISASSDGDTGDDGDEEYEFPLLSVLDDDTDVNVTWTEELRTNSTSGNATLWHAEVDAESLGGTALPGGNSSWGNNPNSSSWQSAGDLQGDDGEEGAEDNDETNDDQYYLTGKVGNEEDSDWYYSVDDSYDDYDSEDEKDDDDAIQTGGDNYYRGAKISDDEWIKQRSQMDMNELSSHPGQEMFVGPHSFEAEFGPISEVRSETMEMHQPFVPQSSHDASLSILVFYTWIGIVTLMVIGAFIALKHRHRIANYVWDSRTGYRKKGTVCATEEGRNLLTTVM